MHSLTGEQPRPLAGRRSTALDRVHISWRRSLTAGINAHFRLRETLREPHVRVLDDPWAELLAEDHPVLRLLAFAERWVPAIRRTAEVQATAHCVRHAAIDALVRRALECGFEQVVVVGAGYEMRASRLGTAWPNVRWFEVDQAALAARKASLLSARADLRPVQRVAVDLRCDALLPALIDAGWRSSAPTLFVVEGLVHYLDRALVLGLLAQMAAGGRRAVALSWIEPAMSRRVGGVFREIMRALGEIPTQFFSAEELAATFAAAQLRCFESWDFAAQVRDFAPAAAGRSGGLTQHVGYAF